MIIPSIFDAISKSISKSISIRLKPWHCRELSSQESRFRQEAADQATESATSLAAAVAATEEEASAELSELKGKLLKEQQEATVLMQHLEATKAQLDQVTVQLTELQATIKSQALPSVIAAEGLRNEGIAAEGPQKEGSSTTCVINLRSEFASMVDAGSQAEFEMGFVEALTQVTIEQLAFKSIGWYQHGGIEEISEHIPGQQGGGNYHDANEQGTVLQGWLEACHAQSYHDRLVAQVSSFNRIH